MVPWSQTQPPIQWPSHSYMMRLSYKEEWGDNFTSPRGASLYHYTHWVSLYLPSVTVTHRLHSPIPAVTGIEEAIESSKYDPTSDPSLDKRVGKPSLASPLGNLKMFKGHSYSPVSQDRKTLLQSTNQKIRY